MASTRLVTLHKGARVDVWADRARRLIERDGCVALWAKPDSYRRQRRISHALDADGLEVNIYPNGSGRVLLAAPPGEPVWWFDDEPVWAAA